ncbi:HEPN domain-containing protein [uncultured Roseobacter sp.]|uniref:HEPN domain-containing protein n=1 Tax=uncultured Roseobacter sp. TaxID=114847 RepID=UPI00260EC8AC|nr:HEPN domain-containing protein [uncultured Roseobacter sp.]
MPSREYGTLRKNVGNLRGQFLNFQKRLDGSYSVHELTQCRAFITFCHAEVEIYLETVASKIVTAAERHWHRHGRVTNAVAAMLAYRSQKQLSLPDNPTEQGRKSKFETLVGNAISAQRSAIKGNHGIMPKNISELYLPIGMTPNQFDEALLIQLKNLGKRRGDHVHQNSQVSLPKVRDPFDDELQDIEFLVDEIEAFDLLASGLK